MNSYPCSDNLEVLHIETFRFPVPFILRPLEAFD